MKHYLIACAAAALALGHGASAGAAPSAKPLVLAPPTSGASQMYIVRLVDAPVAAYTGGLSGLRATKPAAGQSLNAVSADAQAYVSHLVSQQRRVLAAVGNVAIRQSYTAAFNGFSAIMTPQQAEQLRKTPGVASVNADKLVKITTSHTPEFLGLSTPGGLWSQLGGKGAAGENIVIGVIDTGISPENLAFTDKVDGNGAPSASGTLAYGPPPASWKGTCVGGPGFSVSLCNNKLIGARKFSDGIEAYLASAGGFIPPEVDYMSPRDGDGHGTHTASTAGGNNGVSYPSPVLAGQKASGMAPRARIAAYKICWNFAAIGGDPSAYQNACLSTDALSAIDQAVKDGVNVLNYSISGDSTAIDDVDQAFLGAVSAGIFVAAAAGNSGPGSAVAHGAPWLASVAASADDRQYRAPLTLGNGAQYEGGAFIQEPLASLPLVLGANATLPTVPGTESQCHDMDPNKVAGKIVVCDASGYYSDLVAVLAYYAGAKGVIYLNVPGGLKGLSSSIGSAVPLMHLPAENAAAIKAYAAQSNATAGMGVAHITYGNVPAPTIAEFSSRGPNFADRNILKPDFAAPGVDILQGYMPTLTIAEHLAVAAGTLTPPAIPAMLSGTSMASPHVAGVAALLMQQHPTWSPSAIRSALSTTAYSAVLPERPFIATGGQLGTYPWAQGAGQIDATRAGNAGLVYDVTPQDYQRYLCGVNRTAACANVTPLAGMDLNHPAIAAPLVAGPVTIRRSVTNVSAASSTYQSTATLEGFDVQVNPPFLTLASGETKSFTVTLTPTTAAIDLWKYGSLVWSDGVHNVRSPIVANRSLTSQTPRYFLTAVAQDSKLVSVGTPTGGAFTTRATTLRHEVVTKSGTGTSNDFTCQADAVQNYGFYFKVNVAPNTRILGFATPWPTDAVAGTLPQTITLFDPNGQGIAISPGDFSEVTSINLFERPLAGEWTVCASGNPTGALVTATMHLWTAAGNDWSLKAMGPSKVTAGGTATVGLSWQARPDDIGLGWVDYLVGGQVTGSTWLYIPTIPDVRVRTFQEAGIPTGGLTAPNQNKLRPVLAQPRLIQGVKQP